MEEEKIKIEILFPEFCNLFGDSQNMNYLKKCMPKANFIQTEFSEQLKFITEDIHMIYLGPMTEKMQEKVIQKLKPFKEKIEELIQKGIIFLFTGNSLEVLGNYIEKEDGTKIEALGIFDVYCKQDMLNRHNSFFLGSYKEETNQNQNEVIQIVGFKSQFTMMYGDNHKNYFTEAQRGIGIHEETKLEGIKQNHFFGTYLLGPLLILNPKFTKEIMRLLGIEKPILAYEKEIEEAYEQRVKEFLGI